MGTGKTHLAFALGIEAAKQRRRVAFLRAADLARQLIEARDTRELGRLTWRFDRLDLLILDEVGFVPFHRDGGELLFNLIAHRYERRSLIVTKGRSYRMRRRQTQPDPQAAAETGEETKPKKRQRNRPGAWLSFRAATGSVSRRPHQTKGKRADVLGPMAPTGAGIPLGH